MDTTEKHSRWKGLCIACAFALLLTGAGSRVPVAQSKSPAGMQGSEGGNAIIVTEKPGAAPMETGKAEASAVSGETGKLKASAVSGEMGKLKASAVSGETRKLKASAVLGEMGKLKASAVLGKMENPETDAIPTETGKAEASAVPGETEKPGASAAPRETEKPAVSAVPEETEKPRASAVPGETKKPRPSAAPGVADRPEPTEEPVKAPVRRLKAVSGVKLVQYSTRSVKVLWDKHKKANFYRVYYRRKNGNPHLAGVTKGTRYIARKLKKNTDYHFYVVAGKTKKKSARDSKPSKKVHIRTKIYVRKTVFAGDSICEGISDYGLAFPQMHFKGKKSVIAYRGLNTVTFHTKRIFDGKTGLQELLLEKPYRVYMMLGINEIHYRKVSDMLAEYEAMIQAIRQTSPDTDIVLCAISPVTREERARYPGYWQITSFNKKLKKLARKMDAVYFDYTDFLKDSEGYLKAEYAERDGYHWKPPAYTIFGQIVDKFDKSLDK